MEKRYYPALLDFKNGGHRSYFVINRNDETTHFISRLEGDLLMRLEGCRTADRHTESILENEPNRIPAAAVSDSVNLWIKKGFLREEKLLNTENLLDYKNCSQFSESFISCTVTFNRPEMINRWLESRVRAADYTDEKIRIAVFDDTEDKKTLNRTENIIIKHRKSYPGDILHINKNNKKTFAENIKIKMPKSIPDGLIDFSMTLSAKFFDSKSAGSNRNSLILSTAGYQVYSSDDDIEYLFYSKRKTENKRYYFAENYNSEPVFYPDIKELTDNISKISNFNLINSIKDLFSADAKTGAKNLFSNALETIPPGIAILLEKQSIKLRAVSAGYFGGRWFQNPYLPLIQNREDIAHFIENKEKYINVKKRGLNIICPQANILDYSDYIMGGSLFLDNKNIIPPCFPLGRRDDTNLGILMHRCLDPGLTLHMPVALYHNPVEKADFTNNSFNRVPIDSGVYTCLILEKLSINLTAEKQEDKFKEIGSRFIEFGNRKRSDFEEHLKLIQLEYISKAVDFISRNMELNDREPSWWAQDMEKYSSLLKSEAVSEGSVVPDELRIYKTKTEALEIFKSYLSKCGEMLYWWPEIWEAARDLNMEGRGLINLPD